MQLSMLMADMGGRGGHPGFLLLGVLVPLTIIGLVAYGIWERFARGEIDAEDLVQRRHLLTNPAAPPSGPTDLTTEQPVTPDPGAPAG